MSVIEEGPVCWGALTPLWSAPLITARRQRQIRRNGHLGDEKEPGESVFSSHLANGKAVLQSCAPGHRMWFSSAKGIKLVVWSRQTNKARVSEKLALVVILVWYRWESHWRRFESRALRSNRGQTTTLSLHTQSKCSLSSGLCGFSSTSKQTKPKVYFCAAQPWQNTKKYTWMNQCSMCNQTVQPTEMEIFI